MATAGQQQQQQQQQQKLQQQQHPRWRQQKQHSQSFLPFLSALKKLSPDDRVIVLSHLDFKTRDALYKTIVAVLRSRRIPLPRRKELKVQLSPYKQELRQISRQYGRGRTKKPKRKTVNQQLARLGGEPLGIVIDAAIPLLLNVFSG